MFSEKRKERYAYVAALWGGDRGFAVGALVLGQALRATGTPHDLVLMYTDDVPERGLRMLNKIWLLHRVEHVDAHKDLFYGEKEASRFRCVFTKRHALGLVYYHKVLMSGY